MQPRADPASTSPAVAVVHTLDSPCRCHAAALEALRGAGMSCREIDADSLPEGSAALDGCRFAFDFTDTYRGGGDRHLVTRALRRAGVEIIGTPEEAGRIADDKALCRRALERLGAPVAPAGPGIGWPRVVKAARAHGSRGIRPARGPEEEARAKRELAADFGEPVLVEELVEGREIAVAVLGRGRPHLLAPVEVLLPGGLYGFLEKWSDDNPPVARAELPEAVDADLRRRLAAAWEGLGLRDLARFDLRLRPDGAWAILEVNVRPSIEPGGLLPAAAALAGISLPRLVLGLLAGAGGPGDCPWR